MTNVVQAPRARPAARDVVAVVALVAGVTSCAAGGFTVSVTVGLFVLGAGLILLAVLLGMAS